MEPKPKLNLNSNDEVDSNYADLEEGQTPSSQLRTKALGEFSTNKMVQIK